MLNDIYAAVHDIQDQHYQFRALDTDDLAQSVAEWLLEHEDEADSISLSGLVYYRAKELLRTEIRQQRNQEVVGIEDRHDPIELSTLRQDIERALDDLPVPQARTAVLYGAYGYTFDAIAVREDVGLSTIFRRWHLAREALSESLGHWRTSSCIVDQV